MDGHNRTAIIDVDNWSYGDAIVSLTLDYQAQVLYWLFGTNSNRRLVIKRSNIDGTNQQTILRLQNERYMYQYHYYDDPFYHYLGLTVYNETLFLSSSWTRKLYKLGMNGDALLFIDNSEQLVFCRFRKYQLKATNQPSG